MIELILGILSMIVPVILNIFSDKLDESSEKESPKGLENEIKSLYNADNEIDVAVTWSDHDDRLQSLLQEAEESNRQT